jgi:hypothetical protein
MGILRGLDVGARVLLTEDFRKQHGGALDATDFVVEFARKVDLSPIHAVIAEAMKRFEVEKDPRLGSDPWLGPRIHAALRLTRREAADKRIWAYLTVVEFPDYVRWRWSQVEDAPVPLDRFIGHESANALAKLWWATELARNGADYESAAAALRIPGFFWWQKLNFSHHKAGTIAAVRFLSEYGTSGATSTQVLEMAIALNLALRTVCLDAVAASPSPDAEAIREWIYEKIDETIIVGDELPNGPDEARISEADIASVRRLLDELATRINLSEAKQRRERQPPRYETDEA